MIALQFQVILKVINQYETMEWTKTPLTLVEKRLKWDTYARPLMVVVPMLVYRTWAK